MIFVLVHGFNVSDDGKGSIDRLRTLLGGKVHEFNYGWTDLISIYHDNDNLASALDSLLEAIAEESGEEVVPIGHSNGCALIQLVQESRQKSTNSHPMPRAVYLSPALDSDRPHAGLGQTAVLHTKSDWVVKIASILPFLEWGSMGAIGAKGPGWTNFDCSEWCKGHSGYFKSEETLLRTVGTIRKFLEGR